MTKIKLLKVLSQQYYSLIKKGFFSILRSLNVRGGRNSGFRKIKMKNKEKRLCHE